jgi:hypothetical protein
MTQIRLILADEELILGSPAFLLHPNI